MNLPKRFIIIAALAAVVLLYLCTGIFTVAQDEQGVVLRFGQLSRTVDSGLNYRLPWPFEQVYRVPTRKEYYMSVGYKIRDQLRGVAADEKEMQWLTGDTNLVNIRLYIRYRITDPAKFLFLTEEPRFLVRRAAEGMLTELVGETPVDDLLTLGKIELAQNVQRQAQEFLDLYGAGLTLVFVEVEALEPPEQVVSDFNEVKSAERERERAVIEAEGYRRDLLAKTLGDKEKILSEADATYDTRVAAAEADTERFKGLLAEYRENPAVVRDKLYYETMNRLLPKLKINVVPAGQGIPPRIQVVLPQAAPGD